MYVCGKKKTLTLAISFELYEIDIRHAYSAIIVTLSNDTKVNGLVTFIYSSKKVLHNSLLFLCILNFQYLWNLEKWSDQAQIFRKCFLNPLLLIL